MQPDGTITLPIWCSKCKKLHGPARHAPTVGDAQPAARTARQNVRRHGALHLLRRPITDEQRVGGENLADPDCRPAGPA